MSATHFHPPRSAGNEVILRMPLELRERLLELLSAAPDYAAWLSAAKLTRGA